MEKLVDKYINLLLTKAVNFKKSKSLLVSYDKENDWFIEKLVAKARDLGINDIYLEVLDMPQKYDLIRKLNLEEIETHPAFNKKVWDEYAKKGASFICLEAMYPGLTEGISPEKLAKVRYVERITRPFYKKEQLAYRVPWCYGVLPSRTWAKSLFPKLEEKEAYDKLFRLICKTMMLDTEDPNKKWDELISRQRETVKKLDALEISSIRFTNSLGTDITVSLVPGSKWECVGGNDMLVNIPSYEIFTNADCHNANGIVYNSIPLSYGGGIIDNFYLVFKDGKVVDYDAKVGKDLLKYLLSSDDYASYIGEIAFVEYDSPVAETCVTYNETGLDENAACHFAVGNGFPECVPNTQNLTDEELFELGVNSSKNHVDFMFGTPFTCALAETNRGQMLIFKNGKFFL